MDVAEKLGHVINGEPDPRLGTLGSIKHAVVQDICFQLELPFLAILFPSMENIFCSVFGLFNSFKVDR